MIRPDKKEEKLRHIWSEGAKKHIGYVTKGEFAGKRRRFGVGLHSLLGGVEMTHERKRDNGQRGVSDRKGGGPEELN